MISPIKVEHVEEIAVELARATMEWNEPIPDFSTRYRGVLESCLATAFQTYAKRELYPGLLDKAAMVFYQMIKNHPFFNGNKRIAVTTLLTFLRLNDRWLAATSDELYRFSVWVAESDPVAKKGVLLAIGDFLRKHAIDTGS